MAGRPPRAEPVKGVYIRIPPALIARVEHCQWLLQRQQGPRVTLNDAFRKTIETGCVGLEGTLEGTETPAPAHTPLVKLSDIASEDFSVPGYGFHDDPEDVEEAPAPASPTNGTRAPALAVPVPQAAETVSPAPEPMAGQTPSSATPAPELSEDIVKIAEARAEYERMSEREFIQLLYDRGIYRHRAKDGREVPLPHSTYRDWMQRAREAGVL
jgi:hypothetical protein